MHEHKPIEFAKNKPVPKAYMVEYGALKSESWSPALSVAFINIKTEFEIMRKFKWPGYQYTQGCQVTLIPEFIQLYKIIWWSCSGIARKFYRIERSLIKSSSLIIQLIFKNLFWYINYWF